MIGNNLFYPTTCTAFSNTVVLVYISLINNRSVDILENEAMLRLGLSNRFALTELNVQIYLRLLVMVLAQLKIMGFTED